MVTLFRWLVLQTKKVKWELALWQFLDKELTTIAKNPEEIEKKIMPFLAELVHNSVTTEKERMATGEFVEK